MSMIPGMRTTTGKLLLFYTSAFGLMTLFAMSVIDAHWTRLSLREIRAALGEQSAGLGDVFRTAGVEGLRHEIELRERSHFDPEALYALWSADDALLAGNISPKLDLPPSGMTEVQLSLAPEAGSGTSTHAAIALVERLPDKSVLLIGRDVQSRLDVQQETLWLIRWTLAIVAVLGVGGALWGGRRVLRQIDAVATTTRRIAAGELEQRVAVAGSGDEFDRLAVAINAMLERIAAVNTGMQTVIDAVAHDLRRPLTHARQALETALRSANDTTANDLGVAVDALDRIGRTLDALLHIVQADAGINANQMEFCALDEIVRDVVELYEPLAQAGNVRLQLHAQAVSTKAHRQLLAQAVANLIDNAIKYAPASGEISIAVDADRENARITISDHGPGIPPEAYQHVLGRFIRLVGDSDVPGSGLGLSLVAAVVRLHRGDLILADAAPGLRAQIRLPMAAQSPA